MSDRLKRGEPIRKVTLKDGRVRYRVIVDVGLDSRGRRKQVCSTWDTVRDARDELARLRVETKAGTHVAKTDITLTDWTATWLASRHNLKQTTIVNYEYALQPALDRLGHRPIQKITKQDIDQLVTDRLAVVTSRTTELMLVVLTSALNHAVEQGLLARNPAALVDRPRSEVPPVGSAWTPVEARTFLRETSDNRYSHGWHLSLLGLRRGEVLGLRWDDVDLEAKSIMIRQCRVVADSEVIITTPKNSQQRLVPLTSGAAAALSRARDLQLSQRISAGAEYVDEGWVVVDCLGRGIRPETYSDEFRMLRDRVGLPAIRLHDLRHTTASILASAGVPMIVAAGLLGHDPVTYSKTYAHLYDTDLRNAVEGLERLYEPFTTQSL